MDSQVWVFGPSIPKVHSEVELLENQPYLTTITGYIRCVCGTNDGIAWATEDNKLHTIGHREFSQYLCKEPDEDPIVEMCCGLYHNLILTKSGRCYGFGQNSYSQFIGYEMEESWETPREIEFFRYKQVISIGVLESSSLFLCKNGDLYALGRNMYYEIFPNRDTLSKELYRIPKIAGRFFEPQIISQNVKKICTGSCSSHLIYLTKDDRLWSTGQNTNCQLGRVSADLPYLYQYNEEIEKSLLSMEVKLLQNSAIRQISVSGRTSVILIGEDQVYTCGSEETNGHQKEVIFFTSLPFFKNIPIKDLVTDENNSLVLTRSNQLYGFGEMTFGNKQNPIQEIILPKQKNIYNLKLAVGDYNTIIYSTPVNTLIQDLINFYINQEFTDSEIKGIKIHKTLVEMRLNRSIEEVTKVLQNYTKDKADIFLRWVYTSLIQNYEIIKEITKKFGIENFVEKKIENDLLEMYKDNTTKDFSILFNRNENEKNKDDRDEFYVENNYQNINNKKIRRRKRKRKKRRKKRQKLKETNKKIIKIKVHTLILLIRSGLFRNMFKSINKEEEKTLKQINDYTAKSQESLQILIHFFYTNKVKLPNKDCDIHVLTEELEDAIEYYQLHKRSKIIKDLNKLKKIK
ncbi:hypothetical protein M0812_08476 [Anaeramoeba flamelloides]|uniref:BTB domain-containing protein n=1 Tax=Anaeramoeba flamelloides TaxID=1746091 RepID=A0AAV7ZZD3_9EUKA|nr:hypothetical protein M0812_08476 [Anaeramoeba flamelloides]